MLPLPGLNGDTMFKHGHARLSHPIIPIPPPCCSVLGLTTVTVAGLCEATRYIAGYLYCWAIWIEVRTFEITKNIWYLRVQMFVIGLKTSGPCACALCKTSAKVQVPRRVGGLGRVVQVSVVAVSGHHISCSHPGPVTLSTVLLHPTDTHTHWTLLPSGKSNSMHQFTLNQLEKLEAAKAA